VADLIVIACGNAKVSQPCQARDLYCGSMFTMRRRYAEATGLPWLILSAKHGLIDPDHRLRPYDVTMGQPGAITVDELADQRERLPGDDLSVEVVAGVKYVEMMRLAFTDLKITSWVDQLQDKRMGFQRQALNRQTHQLIRSRLK
jgi:hypothetical protein